ncbi:PhzF family phenazine biosynthesis protein [Sporolactobacillus putidus]|uniref:Phenazine biosynthesis protein PhzF n=1 Tax=Sporolactobacillus putidus TaxID=492735 RepID=A0A917S670_9BACL|nr:PhzF family phenazine biosynthesis protein [Sporolactobacillus putidus]GGL60921.1 phenazine biosynthesis protein PhzF [Sporolactobacillus putidus]
MDVHVYTLNAFSKNVNGGNPAGVVLDADVLNLEDKQKIARQIGFSETAFVQQSDIANFKLSYFTPNHEVDLCGHATIATFSLMLLKKRVRVGTYSLETRAGLLEVTVDGDHRVYLSQSLPTFYEQPDREEIADSLNVSVLELDNSLPIEIVSTGLKDILVPIKSVDILNKIKPDFSQITEVSRKYHVVGYHLFTPDPKTGVTACCRNFAPLYDIPEESATGTSTGALTCYLYKYGRISEEPVRPLIFEQGYSMNRPSLILSKLTHKQGRVTRIEVGGTASNLNERIVMI